LFALAAASGAAHSATLDEAIAASKPILDLRLRYERVEQPPTLVRTEDAADALTLRLRAGFETGKLWNTALLVEGEFVDAWIDDYNSTANGRTAYPVVADPDASELNRLQLTNSSLPDTTLTLGRQRINLDDQRFVGNVGWRQNEQTYDALRVVNKGVKDLTVDITYASQANRVFGEHSITQLPRFKGDMLFANLGYQSPLGRLTGFAYVLGLDNSDANSSSTFGLRLSDQKPAGRLQLSYNASWATQADHAQNPVDYRARYLLGELGAGFAGFTGTIGYESLGGDGVKGFATPLATLHKFQGWADVFLATPATGIDDAYASLAWTTKRGPFDALNASVTYHDYQGEQGGAGLGEEINLLASARIKRFTTTLKFADYSGPQAAQDVKKFWIELAAAW
jgi:hypothetical protein